MTRGFITIATGKIRFYECAENLLRSYRYFSKDPMPFALLCDQENRYTRDFDKIIHIEGPVFSYLDKLRLPEYVPFDETIFIDADSLAFRDLNDFWKAFEDGPDFSAFGKNYPPDFKYAWFKKEDAGEYSGVIRSIPDFIGGVYFLRKTPGLAAFDETSRYIHSHYYDYTFRQFKDPVDEPIFALGMAVHGYETAGSRSLPVCFYPHQVFFEADIARDLLRYKSRYEPDGEIVEDGYMIHWGSGNTLAPVYRTEAYKLRQMVKGRKMSAAEINAVRAWLSLRYKVWQSLRALRSGLRRALRRR